MILLGVALVWAKPLHLLSQTALPLKSPTGAFIAPLRYANAVQPQVTFDLNPKLLTHPEQVKVLRFALKPHLEFLKTLDEVLAESSGESVKTA